jgi:branched-subunit amino acid transport protein AzlD
MNTDLVIVALVVGLGTWLFRFLPTRLGSLSNARGGGLTRALESIGPAAIVTLFVASLLPDLVATAQNRPLVFIGCGATVLAFLVRRSVVLATIVGAVAYGLAFRVLAGG